MRKFFNYSFTCLAWLTIFIVCHRLKVIFGAQIRVFKSNAFVFINYDRIMVNLLHIKNVIISSSKSEKSSQKLYKKVVGEYWSSSDRLTGRTGILCQKLCMLTSLFHPTITPWSVFLFHLAQSTFIRDDASKSLFNWKNKQFFIL